MQVDRIDWHYVNLSQRVDRNAHALEQFAKHSIKATRFNAYRPEDWSNSPSKVNRMLNRTPGAIGCYMSQMALIELSHRSGNIVAVCEDDVTFCDDLLLRLEYIASHEKHFIDWDLFYLGATFHVPGKWYLSPECKSWKHKGADIALTTDPRILRTFGIWGTYCYLVNPIRALRVYKLFDANVHLSHGIDHLAIIIGPQLNTYCFVPGCVWQYDNQSNIGNSITHFSHFKKLGPYTWTDRMEEFDPTTFDWKVPK